MWHLDYLMKWRQTYMHLHKFSWASLQYCGSSNVAYTYTQSSRFRKFEFLHVFRSISQLKNSLPTVWKPRENFFNVYVSVHRNNILLYIQQDATLRSLFYLENSLHVSGGTITHHQKRKQLYLQQLVFVTTLLLSAAIVEELEPVWVCCGWRTPPTAHCKFVGYIVEFFFSVIRTFFYSEAGNIVAKRTFLQGRYKRLPVQQLLLLITYKRSML